MRLSKWKKGIGALMCCAAVMGMFSFGGLHTEAALCDHTVLQSEIDAQKSVSWDSSAHYIVYGNHYTCPKCPYEYWEGLYTVKSNHHYDRIGTDIFGNPVYSNSCAFCGYKK